MFACSFLSFFLAAKFFCHLRLSSLSLRMLKLLESSSSVLSTAAFVIVIADAYASWIIVLSLGSSSVEALDLAVAVFDDVASSSSSSSRVGNKTAKNNTCTSSNSSCHSVLVCFAFQLLPQRRLHKYL